MKKQLNILLLALVTLLAAACHKDLDERIVSLKDDVVALEERVSKLNSSISSLSDLVSALEKNDHISGITEFTEDGRKAYRITFTSGTTLVLRSGTDGVSPIVGVRYNEQYEAYYWTIQMGPDGTPTWMTNSYGLRVKATGTVPTLKIEDGIWWYSFDGTSWTKTGWGPAQGESGSSVFTSIDTSDPYFVSFGLGEFNFFRVPTQRAFDELNRMCDQVNQQFKSYTDLVNKIPGDAWVKSVVEYEEGGDKGCRITLESGKVLTIRTGRSSRDSVLLSAKAYTDGKYYWVYRNRSDQEYQWLLYNGQMICVSYEDVTPHIGLTESNGHIYFTIAYAGGEAETMKDSSGNPVEATGRVVLDFFTAADYSDPAEVVLTMADGTVIRLPRTREYMPSVTEFSYQSQVVVPSTQYRFHLLAFVKDTLASPQVLSYEDFCKSSDLKADAIAVDAGGYVDQVAFVSMTTNPIQEGVEYNLIYDIRFTTGEASTWDASHKFRIAFFLTWNSHSLMRVAEFTREIPTTSITLYPQKLSLEVGATETMRCGFRPANTTDAPAIWSSSDPNIATVTSAGVVTAMAEGTCTISVTRGNITASSQCTVTKAATP